MMGNINRVITKEFYEKTLNEAIHEAGPKYTPSIEKGAPNLEIQELIFAFEILGRTRKFYEYLRSLTEEFEKESHLDYSISKIVELKLNINRNCLKELRDDIESLKTLIKLASAKYTLTDDIDFDDIRLLSNKCLHTIGDVDSVLFQEQDAEKPKDKDKSEAINHLIYAFRKLGEIVRKIKNFCDKSETRLANNPFLLLLGEAGIGKTHFLCDIAKKRITDEYPTITLLGHHFQQFTDPGKQITNILGLGVHFKNVLQKLDIQALKVKSRCLIIIDAINEGNKEAWKRSLNNFIKQIEPYKGLGLVISCRIPFEKITIPKRPKPNITVLFHPGFRDIELAAQETFFTYYKIPTPEVPLLTPEFSNPLFLKLFCKSLEKTTVKKKHNQIEDIASGQKGMTYIFEFFVKERGKHIEETFSLSRGYCWNNVFKIVAEKMAENKREWLSKKELKSLLSIRKANAFINKLISEGILHDTLEWEQGQRVPVEAVRFPYQKFSDHIIARYLTLKYLRTKTENEIKESLSSDAFLGSLFRKEVAIYANSGIIEALMIEFPTRIKNNGELLDYLDTKDIGEALIEAFINGLIWRDPKSINDSTSKWINGIFGHDHFTNRILDILVALAVKPKHPYNATKLNRYLKSIKMNKRDLLWSEFLRKQDYHNSIYRILSWVETTKGQTIEKEYAHMYTTILMWALTSTNRSLRDRATRAIYHIGCKFPETLFNLTTESLEINDPYVPERMLAAFYGVAMALQHEWNFAAKILQDFARKLFDLMFKKGALYSTTHILTRDYARHTIDIALLHNSELLTGDERKRITPPFKDAGIRRWGKSEDKNKDEYRDVNYPFGFNFNNYTLGYLIPKRNNYDFDDSEYIKVKSNMWWRIYQLGYSLKDFGGIDKEIAQFESYRLGREPNGRKVDRYGKKYCWIAWYEIAGFRQDKGLLKRERETGDHKRFTVDIDPSFPVELQNIQTIKADYLGRRKTSLPNWITKGPTPDISPYLILNSIQGEKGPWVLLDGYVDQEDNDAKKDILIFPRGLFIKQGDYDDVVRHLEKQDLGGRWLPEIPEHHYTFASEVPWSETFHYNGEEELRFIVSKKLKKVPVKETQLLKNGRELTGDELKEIFSIVTEHREGKRSDKDLEHFIEVNKIQSRKVKSFKKEILEEAKEYKVQIPINTYSLESHQSAECSGVHAYVLSKELCEALELSSRPQTFDLYDRDNRKASLTLKWGEAWHTFHKLIYMRQDLLEKYLHERGLELIWAVWGERRYKSKDNAGLHEFAAKHQANTVFQKIITYLNIIDKK